MHNKSIELTEQEESRYLKRVFIKKSINNVRLSGLSYRLAGILINELDFFEPRKLPKRKLLAEELDVSKPAIIDSLVQLESAGFIIRFAKIQEMFGGDEGQEESDELQKIICEKNFKNRKFKDKFKLNYFYNTSKNELVYIRLKDFIKYDCDVELVGAYSYIQSLDGKKSRYGKILDNIIDEILNYEEIECLKEQYNDVEIRKLIIDILNNSELRDSDKGKGLSYIYIDEEYLDNREDIFD